MGSRVVLPEKKKLDISQGDWLLVKRRLNAGESRKAHARTIRTAPIGEAWENELSQLGLSRIVVYLLDWSLVDPQGQQLAIRGEPPEVVEAALLSLDPESFKEILDAIDAHTTQQDAEIEQEKKLQATANALSRISLSAVS